MTVAVSHEGLAVAQCYFMQSDPEFILPIAKNLAFCDSLGQLWCFMDDRQRCLGYISWLRFEYRHAPLVKSGRAEAIHRIQQLPQAELQSGPLLYIMDTLTVVPGLSGMAGRQLSRLPGVERMAAHIRGRWRERRVVRHG